MTAINPKIGVRNIRKRKVNPHDPLIPLNIWIPRSAAFSAAMESLKERRQHFSQALNLPKGWALNQKFCRVRCPACPHFSLSKRGLKGRPLALATAQLSRKYKAVESLLTTQKQLEHFTELSMCRVKSLSKDYPSQPNPEGDFTPIPFHLLSWAIIQNNRIVIKMLRDLADWNIEHNRSYHGKVTREGALGFKMLKLQSGALYPRWAIWTRGRMGQWTAHLVATPEFGKGYKNPNLKTRIPTRLTALVCAKTGNKKHKIHYLAMEHERAEMMLKIRQLNHDMRSLSLLHLQAAKIKVNASVHVLL